MCFAHTNECSFDGEHMLSKMLKNTCVIFNMASIMTKVYRDLEYLVHLTFCVYKYCFSVLKLSHEVLTLLYLILLCFVPAPLQNFLFNWCSTSHTYRCPLNFKVSDTWSPIQQTNICYSHLRHSRLQIQRQQQNKLNKLSRTRYWKFDYYYY